LFYGFIFVICLGYITNDLIPIPQSFPASSVHADQDNPNINMDDLLHDLEFRRVITGVVKELIIIRLSVSNITYVISA